MTVKESRRHTILVGVRCSRELAAKARAFVREHAADDDVTLARLLEVGLEDLAAAFELRAMRAAKAPLKKTSKKREQ